MKNKIAKNGLTVFAAGLTLALAACGGGSPSAPSAPYNTAAHDNLAQQFITAATAEGLGYTLVKQDTKSQGFVVVQTAAGVLEAFNVDSWNPANQASALKPSYTGLAPAGNGTYSTYISQGYEQDDGYYDADGDYIDDSYWVDTSYYMYFEVAKPTSKDLQKVAAFKQQYEIGKSAEKVSQKFGLSLERATEVAKLAIQVKNTPKMTNEDYDGLSQQLLGVPVAKLDQAMARHQVGDDSVATDVINQAAATNGVGPEQARDLLNSFADNK